MRSAISAVAAISGLLLLGLAYYGQPALYLQQARGTLNLLMERPTASPMDDSDAGAAAERTARLQQQMRQLEDDVAATKAPASEPSISAMQTPPGQSALMQPVLSRPVRSPQEAVQTDALPPQGSDPAARNPEQPGPQVAAQPPTSLLPENREAATASPALPKSELLMSESLRSEQLKSELLRITSLKSEATKAALPRPALTESQPPEPESVKTRSAKVDPQKLAVQKPTPAPPPLPPSTSGRQDTSDTQSVLARLRQQAPGPVVVREADAEPVAEPKPRPAQLSSLPGLTAARVALANGQIEDARRFLQQAQLQLVFHPVANGGESASFGKGAVDTGRALDALSSNNVALSRRYVELALDDLSGTATNPALQEPPPRRSGGYAPAYPPR